MNTFVVNVRAMTEPVMENTDDLKAASGISMSGRVLCKRRMACYVSRMGVTYLLNQ